MRTNSKLAAAIGGVVLTGGLLAGTGTAGAVGAEANVRARSDCPSTYFCVWAGQNYTGRMQKVAQNNADLTPYVVFQGFKSWYNHGASCDYRWYGNTNYGGSTGIIAQGAYGTGATVWTQKSNKWVNCG
ncbi:peptidase inhibitor family I36 protein [Streptomyces sp. NPDC087440]|uniref:peptidase inhibitor family I36 protein n=1 Tax=Streptomyces sp. NPDC087440 TaxID=3365790 RepID=UPI003802CA16